MFHATMERSLDLIWGHQVETVAIDWLWHPWLARGTVAVLDGDPGMGKSSLTMDLAARVTNGQPFPGQTQEREKSIVLMVAMEDPIASVAKPRFVAAGGILERIAFLGGVREIGPDGKGESIMQLPRDLNLIADACRLHKPALLVIDPLFAVLGYDERGRFIKANDDQSVRRLTSRLKKLAEEVGTAIVLVRHLNKGSSGTAVKRGSGSIAIAGQARSVMLAARDPDDDHGRILAMTKTNLAADPESVRYKVIGEGSSSRIEWLGNCDLTADDLVRPGNWDEREHRKLLAAKDFLETVLVDGGKTWQELTEMAAKEGIKEITLRRARGEIGLESKFVGRNRSVWQLPFRLPPIL